MKNTIKLAAQSTSTQVLPASAFGLCPSPGQQLDLSFAGGGCRRPAHGRRQILRSRAQGWFDLMRRVVDNAVEWKPVPLARPEQTAFDLRRAPDLAV
jgi:hypothetical protein